MRNANPILVDEKSIESGISRTLFRLQNLEAKNDGHYVHFYEDDEFLIEAISAFIGKGIQEGEGVLILASAAHREELREKLVSGGIDLSGLGQRGLYISVDADEILSRIMVDGVLDENLFLEIVGGLVGQCLKAGHGLRVFGELVALLVKAGKEETAIRVEELWNRIGGEHFISIFCAYPIKSLQEAPQQDSFFRICNEHAQVIPGGGLHAKSKEGWTQTISRLQQQSFSLEAELHARKQAQQELQSTRDQLAGYLESASIGMKWVGPDGIIQWANEAEYESLGYERGEFVGQPVRKFFADHEVIDDILTGLGQSGKILNREARMVGKDGALRTVLLDCSAFLLHGRFHHAQLFSRDITGQKRGEAIGYVDHGPAAIVESTDDAIIHMDLDGTIRGWNKRAVATFGYQEEEILGKPITQLIPADREDEDYFIRERIRNGEEIHHYESVRVRKNRIPFEVSQTVSSIRNREGRIIGAANIVRDITGHKKNLETLHRASEQLRQYQEMESIGSLAGGIAHDFNNILTVINSYADLAILSANTDGSLREGLNEIKKAGLRAAVLTQQLLAFSRKQVSAPKVFLLNRSVEEMERLLMRTMGEEVDLRLELEPDLGFIEADTGHIHQIILNLAINAREAMPKGGGLTLSTANAVLDESFVAVHPDAKPGPNVVLAVKDTGIGMTEEVKRRIFEPFFTTKEAGKGTGLGLSSVYGIVKQSGAAIVVESGPGKGTEFRIYFPAVTAPAKSLHGDFH